MTLMTQFPHLAVKLADRRAQKQGAISTSSAEGEAEDLSQPTHTAEMLQWKVHVTQAVMLCTQRTFYGDYFVLRGDGDLQFSDSSYTSEALGVHTDMTFFSQPAGIQV